MIPKGSEHKAYCTLTVREVARMFEATGLTRTERSILHWCQPNKMGMTCLGRRRSASGRSRSSRVFWMAKKTSKDCSGAYVRVSRSRRRSGAG
jgi:hypothetical protein